VRALSLSAIDSHADVSMSSRARSGKTLLPQPIALGAMAILVASTSFGDVQAPCSIAIGEEGNVRAVGPRHPRCACIGDLLHAASRVDEEQVVTADGWNSTKC
jgi:hypothetical protein